MSTKSAQGGSGGFLTLDEIAEQDRERARQRAERASRVQQRYGNKGARVWGFQTGGARKGKRR